MVGLIANCLRRLRNDERGVSLIEFAAVAPFLGIFIVGIADLGRGYSTRFALQQAVNRTIELAHHGTRSNDYSFLIAEAAAAADVPATNVVLQQWTECNGGARQAFAAPCQSTQQTARYVTLTVRKSFSPLFTTAGYSNVQPDRTVRLQADASLRVQ